MRAPKWQASFLKPGKAKSLEAEYTLLIDKVAEYIPGNFCQRELPCLTSLVKLITYPISRIVVDGYVHLGAQKRPGLGTKVWNEYHGAIPVIGAAKSFFKDTPNYTELVRGWVKNPYTLLPRE